MSETRKWAEFSPGRIYRYALGRDWGFGPKRLVVIGLNPSTADDTKDDPTIRRCIGFAQREECDGLIMLNLYALRSTDPRILWKHVDPIGPENDKAFKRYGWGDDRIVLAAWGAGDRRSRSRDMSYLFNEMWCLGFTNSLNPRHPLYVKADTPLMPFQRAKVGASGPEETPP